MVKINEKGILTCCFFFICHEFLNYQNYQPDVKQRFSSTDTNNHGFANVYLCQYTQYTQICVLDTFHSILGRDTWTLDRISMYPVSTRSKAHACTLITYPSANVHLSLVTVSAKSLFCHNGVFKGHHSISPQAWEWIFEITELTSNIQFMTCDNIFCRTFAGHMMAILRINILN